jgi:hypothetical protein
VDWCQAGAVERQPEIVGIGEDGVDAVERPAEEIRAGEERREERYLPERVGVTVDGTR